MLHAVELRRRLCRGMFARDVEGLEEVISQSSANVTLAVQGRTASDVPSLIINTHDRSAGATSAHSTNLNSNSAFVI